MIKAPAADIRHFSRGGRSSIHTVVDRQTAPVRLQVKSDSLHLKTAGRRRKTARLYARSQACFPQRLERFSSAAIGATPETGPHLEISPVGLIRWWRRDLSKGLTCIVPP